MAQLHVSPIGQFDSVGTRRLAAGQLLATACLFATTGPLLADCTATNGVTTCTGDFPTGIFRQEQSGTGSSPTIMRVQSLTSDIPFVIWETPTDYPVQRTLSIDTGAFSLGGNQYPSAGYMQMQGSYGGNGASHSTKNGGNGGDAGWGSPLAFSFSGTMLSTQNVNNEGPEILRIFGVESRGGNGGTGGITTCAFPFTCTGGKGGGGGIGGDVSATLQGSLTSGNSANTVWPLQPFTLSTTGGDGGHGGQGDGQFGGLVSGGRGGDGGYGERASAARPGSAQREAGSPGWV